MFKIGIIANEFFCDEFSPLGGFGFRVKSFLEYFQSRPELQTEVIALLPTYTGKGSALQHIHNTKVISLPPRFHVNKIDDLLQYCRRVWDEDIKLLITINYYPNYLHRLIVLPKTPCIFMTADPKRPEDIEKIETLRRTRFPLEEFDKSAGFADVTFGRLRFMEGLFQRKIAYTSNESWLVDRARKAFSLDNTKVATLINPIPAKMKSVTKSEKPTVLFVGRLVAIKRPWIYCEIAKRFPNVDFLVLGEMDRKKTLKKFLPLSGDIPNVHFLSNKVGKAKEAIFEKAWLLVNTSIHEGMPNSVLEAMAYEVPIVSYLDFGGTIAEYGISIGELLGDGLEGVDALVAAINLLLNDDELRRMLGRNGSQIIREKYSEDIFWQQFKTIMDQLSIEHFR